MNLPCISLIVVFGVICLENNISSQVSRTCVWYIYDNPSIDDPLLDFPLNLTEALTVENYVPATFLEVSFFCNQVRYLCAICAEPDINGYPQLGPNDYIVVYQLEPYFRVSDETLRIPNPSLIKEKFTF